MSYDFLNKENPVFKSEQKSIKSYNLLTLGERGRKLKEHFLPVLNLLSSVNSFPCYWIAGGALRSYLSNDLSLTDIDIYFSSKRDYEHTVSSIMLLPEAKFKNVGDYGTKIEYKGAILDFISLPFDGPIHCLEEFDFTVCQFALTEDSFYHGESSLFDLAKKEIVWSGAKIISPHFFLWRILKYERKGFTLSKEHLLFLTDELMKISPKEVEEGRERLVRLTKYSSSGIMGKGPQFSQRIIR